MYINNLSIKDIGPFQNATLDFTDSTNAIGRPVIIITGENGTGKSIIIDAIRNILAGPYSYIERDIVSGKSPEIKAEIDINGQILDLRTTNVSDGRFDTNNHDLNALFSSNKSKYEGNFIINYWSSKLSNDSFNITHIEAPQTKNYFQGALAGFHTNNDLTKLISFFDYLSDSKDKDEQKLGKVIYSLIKSMVEGSINEGSLSHVSRTKLQPIISIRGREISLDKLSSGNLYLIQRLIYLLKQIYSSCVTYSVPVEEIRLTKGLLLIDEAENHLHPKWQKIFLKNILALFPNIQLIVTTHSPFIVSSIENARIYVCKSIDENSIVEEETDFYSNKPVEEILMSPLFNTSNFNEEIASLIHLRKEAVSKNNFEEISRIEKILLEKNPSYFNYLNIENVIKSIKK